MQHFQYTSLAFCISLSLSGQLLAESPLSSIWSNHLSPVQSLGQKLFFDKNLSNPAGQSCATCHDPKTAFTDSRQELPVSIGSTDDKTGTINTPSVMYSSFSPVFHFDASEELFIGGQFLDGRSKNLATQAQQPFINLTEMANPDDLSVVNKVKISAYSNLFKQVYGQDVFDDTKQAYQRIGDALAQFQNSDIFRPFSSKYDYYLAGLVQLNEAELRGLTLFEDEETANCAACHPSTGQATLLTDFSYDNLGLPLNAKIPENPDSVQHERGLANTVKNHTKAEIGADLGKFKVSSLRNISKTAPYMHNGLFDTLEDVVDFYNTRDIDSKWGTPAFPDNMNTDELGDLKLLPQDVKDIVAFLGTLNDGYQFGEIANATATQLHLPYVRLEGSDFMPAAVYEVTLNNIGSVIKPRYIIGQFTAHNSVEANLKKDIPYYVSDTATLDIPEIKVETKTGKLTQIMQLKGKFEANQFIFDVTYRKTWQ